MLTFLLSYVQMKKRSYLRVAVTGSGTCASVLTSTGCIDETNWLDVIVIAETAADCQYHIIVVDCSRIVTWVSSLGSTTFSLSLSRSGSRTSSSCPCICTLFAMSCAHNLKYFLTQHPKTSSWSLFCSVRWSLI